MFPPKRPGFKGVESIDIVDGAPAVPSDVSGNAAYIWMLPSTASFVILACLLAPVYASTFAADLTSAFSGFSYWAYLKPYIDIEAPWRLKPITTPGFDLMKQNEFSMDARESNSCGYWGQRPHIKSKSSKTLRSSIHLQLFLPCYHGDTTFLMI
ncbi:hypothetical protein AVEN_262234-1 [Araneus ventricosus]|uniref:Uncharacterized protein n=1 Tax=Araneus ventricosus TaxID=182803 RepID=A0A4Y2GGT8_ARAVE|nr:hypothetical protein AVEN_262234-1 [Araneus ventricosus]